jgi:hypothetical protein
MRKLLLCMIMFCSVMEFASAASPEEKEIASVFNPPERLRQEMESSLPALKAQRPDLADEISKIPSRFDGNELANRTAAVLEGKLSANEIKSTLAFIRTRAGQAMNELLREPNPKRRKAIENRIDPAIMQNIVTFIASPAVQKIQLLLNSPDAAKIQSMYGREMMCGLIKDSKPKAFEEFRVQGVCAG